jgi:DNA-binding transcriptional ArsR family regulator
MMQNQPKFFKALGDKTRLTIVQCILSKEQCACSFSSVAKKDQTTVSRHLKILVEAGILRQRKEGRNIYYAINDEDTKKYLFTLGLKPIRQC